ncbi:hypothetical protein ACR2V2_25915 [Klebsiella pneumoniae]
MWTDPAYFNDAVADQARACCLVFQGEVQKRLNNGNVFESFAPIFYQTQVVAGINYKIMVSVGGDGRVEMEVFWGLGTAMPELTSAEWLLEKQQTKK